MRLELLRLARFADACIVKVEESFVHLEHGCDSGSALGVSHLPKVFTEALAKGAVAHSYIHKNRVRHARRDARLNDKCVDSRRGGYVAS